ncbi:autotransporter-associated beta strand repeat-containing protein (plasmid) [Ensifer adhaerens]|uniref:autotransporter-associated beta strand repeat-containing protein n=1 Tax=Ensifer adhaerens TaxID=106592 RepID=UPI0023A990D2|nr:autotransporter-associated beta strand repeat-containing protein [Ensifer adhaerens]WDZ80295.1 autotransporter-associated beta strand repeat-containing protein [Ensifer adhaerens]
MSTTRNDEARANRSALRVPALGLVASLAATLANSVAPLALIVASGPALADSIGQNGAAGGNAPNYSTAAGGGGAGTAGDGSATGTGGGGGDTGGSGNRGGSGGASDSGGGGGGGYGLGAGGGGGGAGGAGLTLSTDQVNNATIKGGNGGNGGFGNANWAQSWNYAGGGGGGGGGSGIIVTTGTSLTNSGLISGGNGGGGADVSGPGIPNSFANPSGNGVGGNGGNGITATASGGLTITNSGTIQGGGGGTDYHNVQPYRPQAGGYGIIGQNLSITNSGTIAGGARGGAGVSPGSLSSAIVITGGTNTITALAGSIGAIDLNAGATTLAGVFNNTVQVNGGATLALGASGDATGFTSLSNAGGTITIGDGNTLSAGTIANFSGGRITLGVGSVLFGTGNTLNNDATIDVGTDGVVMDNGDINNNAGGIINFNGPGGTAQLSPGTGNVNNSGRINVVGGDVDVRMSNINNQGNGLVSLTGGDMFGVSTLTNSGTATLNIAAGRKLSLQTLAFNGGTISGAGTIEATNAFNLWGNGTVGATLAGAANLTRGGPGTTILTGNHTYTGGTTVHAGELQLGTAGTAGSIRGQVNVNGAGTFTLTNADTTGVTGITNAGKTYFYNTSSAAGATIANTGELYFYNTSSAGSAVVTNSNFLEFHDTSTAGNSNITNNSDLLFYDNSRAGTATIANNSGSFLNFHNTSTADNAGITNDALLSFYDSSTAGSAEITNNRDLTFYDASGAGSARITNNDTLTFRSTTTAGSARITNNSSLAFLHNSNAGDAEITNGAAGIVDFSGSTGSAGNKKLTAGSIAGGGSYLLGDNELTVGSNGLSTDVSGTISGTGGSLVKAGAGTLTLTGENTYSGGTTISGGVLRIGNDGVGGSILGNVANNGVLAFNRSDAATFAGAISGNGAVRQTGSGTTVLTGANGYAGGTTISGGTLQIGNGGATGSILGDVVNDGILAFNRSDAATFAGAISGSGAVRQIGSGTMTLTGANTYTGGTTVAGGTLQIGNGSVAGSILGDVVNDGILSFNRSNAVTFAGAISGSGAVRQIGSGTTVLTGSSTHTGGTTIASGVLQIGNGGVSGSVAGDVVNDGVLAFNRSDAVTVAGAISGSGSTRQIGTGTTILTGTSTYTGGTTITGGTLQLGNGGATGSILGDVVNYGIWAFNRGDALTFSGAISGSGSTRQIGSGTTILTGTNTYTGGTTITGGTLQLGNGGTIGSILGDVVNDGVLAFNRGDAITFSGAISGSGAVRQIGSGTTVLIGANSYTGGTTVAGGTLQIGNGGVAGSILGDVVNDGVLAINRSDAFTFAGAVSGNGAVRQIGSGTTILTGTSSYIGGTTISGGTVQLGNGGVTGSILGDVVNDGVLAFNRSDAFTFSGAISGSGAVQQIGTGTTVLTGNNTYTGDTTVAGGQLQFGGGGAGGTNTLGGNLIVTGGTLAIQTPAAVNVAQAVTFADNTALSIVAGTNTPALSADSITIGNGVGFNIGGINDASQLDKVLIDTRSGISGDFASVSVGGFNGTVDYLTMFAGKSADNLQYLASYGLSWTAGNNLAHGTFTLANATDSFTVGAALVDQVASPATGWSGTSLTKAGAGTLILTGSNTYSGGTTISGGVLQLGNGGVTGSILGDVVNDGVLAFNRSDAHTFAGAISGNGAMRQTGSGTTILTGSNSYTGGTTVAGGTLQIGNGGVAGLILGDVVNDSVLAFNRSDAFTFAGAVSGNGAVRQIGSGTTILTGSNSYTDGTTVAGGMLQIGNGGTTGSILGDVVNNGMLAFNRSDAVTFAGAISGNGAVWQTGSGTAILTGSNSYTGGTTISGGMLQIGNGGTTGSILGDVVNNGMLAFNRSDAFTFAGAVSGNGAVRQIGSGTTVLTGSNSYTGGTTVAGGTLQIGNGGVAGLILGDVVNDSVLAFNRSDAFTFAGAVSGNGAVRQIGSGTTILTGSNSYTDGTTVAGGTLQIGNGGATGSIQGDVVNDSVLAFNRSDAVTFAGAISGRGAVRQTGTGTTILTGSNSYTGGTTVAGGTLQIGNGGATGSITGNVVNDGVLAFNRSDAFNFAGAVSGNGAVRQVGSGTTILTGDNTYTGGTTVTGGTLQIGNGGASGAIAGNVLNHGVLAFNRSDTLTFSGSISGSGTVQQIGSGTAVLTGSNAYMGDTIVSGGRLQFGDGSAGGSNSLGGNLTVTGGTLAILTPTTLTVERAVTLDDDTALSVVAGTNSSTLTANRVTIGDGVAFSIGGINDASQLDKVLIDTRSGISGDFASVTVGGFNGTVDYLTVSARKSADNLQYLASYGLSWTAGNNLAHGTFTLTDATDSFTVGAALADQVANSTTGWSGSSLTKAGAGTLILTGSNSYTGGTTIAGGVLSISRDANLGATTGGLSFSGGTLMTTASFDTARAVSLRQAGRFDVAANTEFGVTGIVSGSGDLIKQGNGTLRLDNGANAYGNTLVAAGTLIGNARSISGDIRNAGSVAFDQVSDASFAGDISALNGARGTMTKRGAGALTLTGTSSLDWTVEAGALVSSAERFTGNAAIASGASLAFDQAANAAYAGVLSGNGDFNKTGLGKLNLTGNSSAFSGTTTVGNGTLSVNGVLGGTVDVLAGGRLQGSGSVRNVKVSGTVAPGNSIGTLNVAGNVTLAAGSTYEVEVNAAGQSDRIVATGTATIGGGSVKVLADTGSYAPETKYTILTANGGRSGTFGGVSSNLAFLDPSLSYDASNAYLKLTRNNIDFSSVGVTPNQIATGDGVESLGRSNTVYNAITNLSAPQARNAFDQLSGEIHASLKSALTEDSRFTRNAINERLRAAFDTVDTANSTVTSYVDGKPVAVDATTDRLAFWSQGFGSWGHTDGDGNAARLNRSTGGFFAGADAPAFDNWRFGAIAGYSHTSFDVKDRYSSGSSDNYHVGLYGGANWGDLALRAGAAYTWHDVSTSRNVNIPGFNNTLKGDYDAGTAQVFGELGYGFPMGAARFEPFANVALVSVHTDGFTESGGAAALGGQSDTTESTLTTLGLRASTTFDLNGAALTVKGMAGWRHAFGDVLPLSAMRFAGGGDTFSIAGVPIARNVAVIEAGLDYALSPSATLGVTYAGQFGSDVSDQSARVNLNIKF